jgi:hypothetical protein
LKECYTYIAFLAYESFLSDGIATYRLPSVFVTGDIHGEVGFHESPQRHVNLGLLLLLVIDLLAPIRAVESV